jgi:diaminobutyrate-2-oxoglutarate transaminase
MSNNNLAQHAMSLGDQMLSRLRADTADTEIVGDVRGKGLMLGVEFVKDRETKEPAADIAAKVRGRCHQKGLLIEIGGHYFNVARFLPPLVLTSQQAQKGIEIFCESVEEVAKSYPI